MEKICCFVGTAIFVMANYLTYYPFFFLPDQKCRVSSFLCSLGTDGLLLFVSLGEGRRPC